jgi:Ca2+/Na+ antiporter
MYETTNAGGFSTVAWLIFFVAYFYFTFAQFKIAQKLRHQYTWFAFIPLLNTFQLVQLARKPLWWFVLCLIPFINIICFAILWIDVAKYVSHPPILGFLTIIPPICFVTIGILAFSQGKKYPERLPEQVPVKPREPEKVS